MSNVYVRLAKNSLKNNKTLYIPYMISGIVTVMMFYLMMFLNNTKGLKNLPGAYYITSIMAMGLVIIGIFSYIYVFYTNSFIIKRRKKEIGIYNILGMEKRHIAKVLGLETITVAVIAIAGGIGLGILFSKMVIMLIYRILQTDSIIAFAVPVSAVTNTIVFFGILYFFTLLYNFMQVRLVNSIELLRGGHVGEKEPKTKALLALAGVICLGVAYGIAITTKQPLEVLEKFFVAVLLVIVGTYFLFIAGSIAVLKIMRKNKRFYYNKTHFTAVSGMLYRMKQNAAGLASICILSTMVMVMVSMTVSMFVGLEDELQTRYPNDIRVFTEYEKTVPEQVSEVSSEIIGMVKKNGGKITDSINYSYLNFRMTKEGQNYTLGEKTTNIMVYFMTREDFLSMDAAMKEDQVPVVKKGKVFIYQTASQYQEKAYADKTVSIMGKEFQVQGYDKCGSTREEKNFSLEEGSNIILVDGNETLQQLLSLVQKTRKKATGIGISYNYQNVFGMDLVGTREEKMACAKVVQKYLIQEKEARDQQTEKETAATTKEEKTLHQMIVSQYMESREANRQEMLALDGSLVFLGIFLGSIFLVVTVMIIFYKQVSEGFDDKERYRIMEQVGMSNAEVKESIEAQIRMVFFLPIVTAAIHVTAAFPMIRRILSMLNLTNGSLFTWCLVTTVGAFAVIYYFVFRLTSRAYYQIVGNQVR